MVTIFDVEPRRLIVEAAAKLEEMKIEAPSWVGMVKSGPHAERLPQEKNFFYIRAASILRQAYTHGPVGVSRLRTHYGGRKKRGVRPDKARRAGGSLIRKAMQSLEKAELLAKNKKKDKPGRVITAKGMKLLDAAALAVSKKAQNTAAQ